MKGIFADFLGFPAYTPLGASRLLADTEAALVPMAMTRKEDGNYRFIILPELPTVKTENRKRFDNQHSTSKQFLLRNNSLYPQQWVWMYRRWKTTPKPTPNLYVKKQKKRIKHKIFIRCTIFTNFAPRTPIFYSKNGKSIYILKKRHRISHGGGRNVFVSGKNQRSIEKQNLFRKPSNFSRCFI